ncbi:MAG: cyclic nucleotide-binding domain-containing protein [Pseudomonadota bacterium]
MSLDTEVEALKKVPLFANIEPSKLKLMAFASERLTFKPGQILVRQGDQGDAAYIILEGEAEVVLEQPDESEVVVATLTRNAVLGEIAILCDVPRTATVRAKAKTETLKITKDLFFRLVQDFPQIGMEVMRILAARLEKTTQDLFAARGGH